MAEIKKLSLYVQLITEIKALIRKEFLLDMRSKNILVSTVVYVFSTVFVCYLAIQSADPDIWNALVWITVLFAITNAAGRIFLNESGQQKIYLYTLAKPESVIISKLIYQWILSVILASLVLLSWIILFNQTVANLMPFTLALILGVSAMSNVLTLNNAIAMESKNGATILAILSFPVIVPIIMTSIKACKMALTVEVSPELPYYLVVLAALNALTLSLSYILFPYLWRY